MMKRRFLFLFALLSLLFAACNDVAQDANNSLLLSQIAQMQNGDDTVRAAVAGAESAVSAAKAALNSSNAESSDTKLSDDEAVAALNAAITALNEALNKLSAALKTRPSDADVLTAIAKVETAIDDVKVSIEKRGQNPTEPTPPEGPKDEPVPDPLPIITPEEEYELKVLNKVINADNGKYVILFVGSKGWTKEKEQEFFDFANLAKTTLFSLEPFKSYQNYIDVYAARNEFDSVQEKVKQASGLAPNVIHTITTDRSGGHSWLSSRSLSGQDAHAVIHELGHSIGGLWDEYNVPGGRGKNVPNTYVGDKGSVPWKAMQGFNDVKVHISTTTPNRTDCWVPTLNCVMSDNTGAGRFCEVCKYALAVRMSSAIKNTSIAMYDESGFEYVIPYDTYSALKEYLKNNNKQNEPTKQSANIENLGNGNYRIFAKGITANTAKYDAIKRGNDSNLCWAATSANLIAWWQDLYETSGKKLPNLVTKRDAQGLFGLFKEHNPDGMVNKASTFLAGVPWYFVGNQSGNGGIAGGYLSAICGYEWSPYRPRAYAYFDENSAENNIKSLSVFSSVVIAGLRKGAAAGLKLHGAYDHAITLWGAEYDGANMVTAIYVTDSDDYKTQMQRCEIGHDRTNVTIGGGGFNGCNKITGVMFLHAP